MLLYVGVDAQRHGTGDRSSPAEDPGGENSASEVGGAMNRLYQTTAAPGNDPQAGEPSRPSTAGDRLRSSLQSSSVPNQTSMELEWTPSLRSGLMQCLGLRLWCEGIQIKLMKSIWYSVYRPIYDFQHFGRACLNSDPLAVDADKAGYKDP